ncbi:hypothetical protein GL264_01505 [Aeromonas jandaei]|uniref:hypothetical protein n=1 Tax=Aeromonas jandaei TaxID=650 RepID=UPI001C5B57C7|nr:hypothetical protein [Aeromonas jandaei]MBW3759502.1 hypothetical protein [Aeromonas jandaei]
MKIAHDLYDLTLKWIPTKKKLSPSECLKNMESYLYNFRLKYLKVNKRNNDEHIISTIYRDTLTFKTETEFNSYAKCQLNIAIEWFYFLVKEIKADKKILTRHRLQEYGEYIRNFLHDISFFIDFFERKDVPSFCFLDGFKNHQQRTAFIYQDARTAYWSALSHQNRLSHNGGISASCYFLRQCLEVKFKRILGVHEIYDKNNQPLKIRHDFFPNFIKNNHQHFELFSVNITSVFKIYKWTNSTIHTSATPLIWEQWYALRYCEPFIYPTDKQHEQGYHLHGSVVIKNIETLWLKLYERVYLESQGKVYYCFSMTTPEAVLK